MHWFLQVLCRSAAQAMLKTNSQFRSYISDETDIPLLQIGESWDIISVTWKGAHYAYPVQYLACIVYLLNYFPELLGQLCFSEHRAEIKMHVQTRRKTVHNVYKLVATSKFKSEVYINLNIMKYY